MDNMLFWKILKSVFGSSSDEFKRKIEYMLSWDRSVINNDNWIKMLKFVNKTFEDTSKFPLYEVFIAQFPETSWFFESTECVSEPESLSQLIMMFENNCHNRIASMKLQEYSQKVAVNGMTMEGLNELKQYAKIVENNCIKLTEEEEYDKKIVNITSMKTGISEIDELTSIPKGAVITIAGFTGSFKCVAEGTLVNTNNGLMRIEDIYALEDPTSMQVLSEIGYRNIKEVHYDGKKPTIKVFVNGRLIETSPVHRFRVITGDRCQWICAKDLKINDKILIKKEFVRKDYENFKNITFKQFKDIVKEDYSDKKLKNNMIVNNEYCSKQWAKLPYNKETYKDRFKTNVMEAFRDGRDLNINDLNTRLPDYIFSANPEAQSAFLNGLFQTNGTILKNEEHIGITCYNYNLLNSLTCLLLSMEVSTKILKIRDFWRLTTDNYYTKFDLFRSLSFFNPEKNEFEIFNLDRVEYDNYINEVENSVKQYRQREKTTEEIDYLLCYQYVTAIEYNRDGKFLFDLTVDGHPSYIANGCVTHNTTTAANIVYRNVYENGYNFAYISLEVTRFDLLLNLWCLHSLHSKFDQSKKIPTKLARDGKLSQEQKRYLFDVIVPDFNNNSKGKLKIIDESNFKTFSEGEIIQRLEEIDDEFDKKLDGVVLDHANLCKFYSPMENTTESTNRYVSLFRRLSNAFRYDTETGEMRGLTAILLAQTNRTGWHEAAKKNGAYDLTALAEANELERCSSVILTVFHDKNLTNANELKVCLLKNRYGQPHADPIITDVYPEYYYVGDKLENYEYDANLVELNDLYDKTPKSLGFSNSDSYYDSDEYF